MATVQTLGLLLFPALMTAAAISDMLTMTISNKLSLLLVACFFVFALFLGMPAGQIGMHILAALVILLAGFVCFAFGWVGGGDAKLAAATALWLGWNQIVEYILLTSILGGGLTLALLALRALPLPVSLARQSWMQRLREPRGGIPYGIALAMAGLFVYPHTVWMKGFGV